MLFDLQVSSGFKDYTLKKAYPDGYLLTPAYKPKKPSDPAIVSVQCSGYCK